MLRNTESSYGSVAKWLHWLIALWIVVAYAIILYLTGRTEERPPPGLNYHKAVGFTILIPVLLRISWSAINPKPVPPDGMPRWQIWASHLSHFLLYFLLLAMPLSGYFGNGGGVDYGSLHVTSFRDTRIAAWIFDMSGLTYPQWNDFFDTFHYGIVGPYVFWVLILVHAGAAVYHHVVQKDDVLIRMLPRER